MLTGLRPITRGEVMVDGEAVRSLDPATFAGLGIGHIPEDRLRSGARARRSASPTTRCCANTSASPFPTGRCSARVPPVTLARTIAGGGRASWCRISACRCAICPAAISSASWPGAKCGSPAKLLVAAYPSRGLDVGAINTMLRYFVEIREAGVAVVLISEELEELLNLSDRIAVIFEGRIMGTFTTEEADLETIGLLMGGRAGNQAPAAPHGCFNERLMIGASNVFRRRQPAPPCAARIAAIVLALVVSGVDPRRDRRSIRCASAAK